jgi:hypothetical protein
MATASGTSVFMARGVVKHTWTLTSAASVGRPATLSRFPDKTVHVRGTFGGATIIMCGANHSATVALSSLTSLVALPVNDTRGEGNAASFAAANIVQILENPNLLLPRISVLGTGTGKNIIVEVVAQSTRR